jgi:hypothetical protein
MRRVRLIFLSLVLALVGWSTVGAEDGFYVVPAMRGNYAPVPKTGQTTPYAAGDDGTLKKGVASPTPRLTDNNNGTVTDKLTGLIWTKNANAFSAIFWANALITANTLASGSAGLTDGSKAGDWRLPNRNELESLVDCGKFNPALPADHPFTNVQLAPLYNYWSSTTYPSSPNYASTVNFRGGNVTLDEKSTGYCYVWCVRDSR